MALQGGPLPLGAIDNQRSFVGLDNLVDLIITCLEHPAAANQTFLVSDSEDISTAQLLCRMAKVMGKAALLIPVPIWLLTNSAVFLGDLVWFDVYAILCSSIYPKHGNCLDGIHPLP